MNAADREELTRWLRGRIRDHDLIGWARELLVELCSIDTSLGPDTDRLRNAEKRCFDLIGSACRPYLTSSTSVSHLPIDASRIVQDVDYTTPYYVGDLKHEPTRVYEERTNLLLNGGSEGAGRPWLMNAHIDTVPPHFSPSMPSEGVVAARGAADDKGGVVTAALVLRLLDEWHEIDQTSALPPVQVLVSIDEEMGGNGTLAALTDVNVEGRTVVVIEPTSLRPYPANRGATWFEVDVEAGSDAGRKCLPWAFRNVTLALFRAGRQLREDSSHPLFSERDVAFCLGVMGPFGSHPSSACDNLELRWGLPRVRSELDLTDLEEHLIDHLKKAVDRRGVFHRSKDPEIDISSTNATELRLVVHAIPGHMGSHERDSDAIVKLAELLGPMEDAGLGAPRWPDEGVHLEGGQGFLPDRSLAEVQDTLRAAFRDSLERTRDEYGLASADIKGEISFDKLHNAAYSSSPDAIGGPALAEAVSRMTEEEAPELSGWKASCDGRLFARRSEDVVTFGPGHLEDAHGPSEEVELRDVGIAAAALVLAITSAADEDRA